MKYTGLNKLFVEACTGLATLNLAGNKPRMISGKSKRKSQYGIPQVKESAIEPEPLETLVKCVSLTKPEIADLITQEMWIWMHYSKPIRLSLDQATELLKLSRETILHGNSNDRIPVPQKLVDDIDLKRNILNVKDIDNVLEPESEYTDQGSNKTLNRSMKKIFEYLCISQIAFKSVKKDCHIICILSVSGNPYICSLPFVKGDDEVYKVQSNLNEGFLVEYDPRHKSMEMKFYEIKYTNEKNIHQDQSIKYPVFRSSMLINDENKNQLTFIPAIINEFNAHSQLKSINPLGSITLNTIHKSNSKVFSVLPINLHKSKGKTLGRVSFWIGLYVMKVDDDSNINKLYLDNNNNSISSKYTSLTSPLRALPSTQSNLNSDLLYLNILYENFLTFFFIPKNSPFTRMITVCKLTKDELLIYSHPPKDTRPVGGIPLTWILEVKPNSGDIIYEPNSLVIVTKITSLENLDYTFLSPRIPIPVSMLVKENDFDKNYSLIASADTSAAYISWLDALKDALKSSSSPLDNK